MRISTALILISTLLVNLLIWVTINKPHNLVETSYPVNSFSFNPYKKNQNPYQKHVFTEEELEGDITLLKDKTRTVRLYSSLNGVEQVPDIAKKYNMKVIVSAFLNPENPDNVNDLEVSSAIEMAKKNKNVTHVIIGNETQLQREGEPEPAIKLEILLKYLSEARKKLKTPVSTAEPWDYWLNHPEMAEKVDFIAIHALPYWNESPIESAVDYVLDKYNTVQKTFPNKKIMIAETGWPSDGPQRGAAQASRSNQAWFVREFIRRAEAEKINYNIIEAFDQPWKSALEGRAGEHWGIMDADRREKFQLKGPVLEDPNWKYWALSSTLIGFLAAVVFLMRRPHLKKRGQFFSMIVFQLAAAFATQMAREASDQYMSPGDIVFWTFMITAQAILAIILLTDAVEIADVVGSKPLQKKYLPANLEKMIRYPMVSIHLACCREPPDMVIATINSLSKLDYPNFEVIVVDNNTPDEALWKPIQDHCEKLGSEKFRFFSIGSWPGFKAGALNFALRHTHEDARVVGVVDADYIVEPDWLKSTIPYFDDLDVAVVQAPQEHRDWKDNVFQRMENDEYSGFFRIGMVQRNEHNAIIQHGTMTLISRGSLHSLGGWSEWCICEDAELGLRILNDGKKAVYLDHAFGHGLVPDSYEAYAKQRFRWAYGAMRILRHHWRVFLGLSGKLNAHQRYQFVKGWLPWVGDAFHLLFTVAALVWTAVLISNPLTTDFPEPIFIYPALALVVLRIFGTIWTYAARVRIGRKRTLLALIAGGSLTHRIARAVLQGLVFNSQPFYRTPKMDRAAPIIQSLIAVREELILALALWFCAFIVIDTFGWVNREAVVWGIALVVQTFPYVAAVAASIISSLATNKEHSRFKRRRSIMLY